MILIFGDHQQFRYLFKDPGPYLRAPESMGERQTSDFDAILLKLTLGH